jgi:hypothetical protein
MEGEIKLDYPATSAVVIDDKTLAVAAHVSIVFIDTQTFKRIDSIPNNTIVLSSNMYICMLPVIDFNICDTFPDRSIIINPRVMQLTTNSFLT